LPAQDTPVAEQLTDALWQTYAESQQINATLSTATGEMPEGIAEELRALGYGE
jgi:hypothetical protein